MQRSDPEVAARFAEVVKVGGKRKNTFMERYIIEAGVKTTHGAGVWVYTEREKVW